MRIEAPMTIYTAGELKIPMLEAVRTSEAPRLDLSAVGEMDSAGLQLILLAKREAASLERVLQIAGASQAVREVLDLVSIGVEVSDTVAGTSENTGATSVQAGEIQ